ncbi:MAG: hypothetical protein VX252_10045 [Myxococcota bacterium]|nr:hypothetical protein [Myxococcota bacterium]
MNQLKKPDLYICMAVAVFLLAVSPAWADSPFETAEIRVTWEYWNGGSPGQGGALIVATDTVDVVGDDAVDPDLISFHTSPGTEYELWDIDFWEDEIQLTYTSIYVQDSFHQYMYLTPVGIHFEDHLDQLPDITQVWLDDGFAPYGLDPLLLTFDADNIWLSLEGSMCHFGSMGSMPDCLNPASPTGFDNEIVLIVETVPEPGMTSLLISGVVGLVVLARRHGAGAPGSRCRA